MAEQDEEKKIRETVKKIATVLDKAKKVGEEIRKEKGKE